jgi:hypothetical protein
MAWEDEEQEDVGKEPEPVKPPSKPLVRQGKNKNPKKRSGEAEDLDDIQKNWKPPYSDKGGVTKEMKRRMSYKNI